MRRFHQAIVAELEKHAGDMGEVTMLYADVASAIGESVSDVMDGIRALKDDGYFPGKPMLANDTFMVRVPDADTNFRAQMWKALRAREDKNGNVQATYDEIALAIGGGVPPDHVHHKLLQMREDGEFEGQEYFDGEQFQVRLPEADD